MASSTSNDWNRLLANKVVFITGAAGRIAKYLARACYAQGARLVLGDLDPMLINQLTDELGIKEGVNDDRILIVTLDVTNETIIQEAVQAAINKWTTIDVLLNV